MLAELDALLEDVTYLQGIMTGNGNRYGDVPICALFLKFYMLFTFVYYPGSCDMRQHLRAPHK